MSCVHNMMADNDNKRLQKWSSIVGSMLINFLSRIPLYWGNMTVYVVSYHVFLGQTGTLVNNSYFYAFYATGWTSFMLFTDVLTRWVRPRYVILIGLLIFNSFYFGSAFSEAISWETYLFLFAFVAGAGLGLFESLVLKHYVIEWAGSDDKGMLTSLFVTSTAVGGSLANQVMTLWMNPSNLTPDLYRGFYVLFSNEEICRRVPSMFLLLGATSAILQSIGFCLLRENKDRSLQTLAYSLEKTVKYDSLSCVNENGSNPLNEDRGIGNSRINSSGEISSPSDRHDLDEINSEPQTVVQLLRHPDFQKLYFIFFALNQSYQAINSFYKVYGSLWIQSDFYFSTLGTVMVIPGFVFNVVVGKCFDKFGLRLCYIVISSSLSCLSLLVYFSAMLSPVLYFVTVVVLFTFAGAMYMCAAASIVLLFGSTHLSRNFALAMSATGLGSITVSCVSELVLSHNYGWFWVFAWVSTFGVLALIVTTRSFSGSKRTKT